MNVYDIKLGLAVSILLHGIVLYGVVSGLPLFERDFPIPPRPIPVELVDLDQLTRAKEVSRAEPVEEETPTPPRQRIAEKAPADTVPMPDAKPQEKPDKLVIQRKKLVQTVTPNVKPRPPSNFDSSKIAALIDRSIKEQTPTRVDNEQILEDAVKSQQVASLEARRVTTSFEDYIRAKMRDCWSVPAGARDLESLKVVIEFSLTPEGRLLGAPKIKDQYLLFQPGNEYLKIFAESAGRAIRLCEPYNDLPKDDYNLWQSWELTFRPTDMLG